MKYMTYCLKFKLYAQHYIYLNDNRGNCHAHTWKIALYIGTNGKFTEFNKYENVINEILSGYTNTVLNDLKHFENIEPTLENIGEVLFKEISNSIVRYGVKLDKLEISETPSRIYIVRNKDAENVLDEKLTAQHFLNKLIQNSVEIATRPLHIYEDETEIKSIIKADDNAVQQESEITYKPLEFIKEVKNLKLKTLGAFLFIMLSGIILLLYINRLGRNPWGSDSFGHIFKADMLYKSIKNGVFYPLYTNLWYNGIQPFRYWAPLPYYILAFFQLLANGDPIFAYNIFIYFCYTVGAIGWLLWGINEKKIFVSVVIGVTWFCMPDNIRVFFSEGNIPRITIAFLLPYMFFFIWQYIEYKKKYSLIVVIFLMSLISMCHLMIAAMLGITTFIFLLYYGIQNRHFGRPLQILIGMIFGIMICGVWLYPALQGGLMSIDAAAVAEVMKALTFPFSQSLNPFFRFTNIEIFYFGLSFIIVSIIGVFLSNKKSSPGFLTILTVFLGTTTSLVPILIKLPLNQLLWMMRFTPIAYAIFSLSLILWKNIRRFSLVMLMLIVIADSACSFKLLAFNSNPSADTVNMLDEAAKITSQRIAISDGSEFGSFPSYYLCSGNKQIPYAYGWAWQGASTAENIVLLNTSLEKEYYGYMFDRCIELGCDTVLIKKDKIKNFYTLNFNANASQYYLVKDFYNGYLYKRETPINFCMTVKYYGLAIGKSASNVSLEFPGYQVGKSNNLDDYTFDELLNYEMIYLSGFTYKNKNRAEELMYKAAQSGIKIIIDMNTVPNDPITNRLTFMNITAQPIQFENKLPDLHMDDGSVYFPVTFKEEFRNWNTVYLEDVPNPTGFSWMGGNKLTFMGYGENQNITYIGFNLLYHGMVNEDNMAINIYANAMGKNSQTLPKRVIYPMNVQIIGNKMTIDTPTENVNTTVAYSDAFVTKQDTYKMHNLLCTKDMHTEIDITYPYIKKGIFISIAGLIVAVVFLWFSIKARSEAE